MRFDAARLAEVFDVFGDFFERVLRFRKRLFEVLSLSLSSSSLESSPESESLKPSNLSNTIGSGTIREKGGKRQAGRGCGKAIGERGLVHKAATHLSHEYRAESRSRMSLKAPASPRTCFVV